MFVAVLKTSRQQLTIALCTVLVVLLIASSAMHLAERAAQPEEFGSIPASMWWGVATLTTVGYGDVRPVTDIGRVLAGFIAILGIGTFAIPAGIIAGAFERVVRNGADATRCPVCGSRAEEGVGRDV